MRLLANPVLCIVFFLFGACKNPADDLSKGKVEAAKPELAAKTTAGEVIAFSNENSKVSWTASKVTGSHDGGFKKFIGKIKLDTKIPENSTVTVTIDTASLYTSPEKLATHLKSPDFFDVAKFPKATFTSTKIIKGGNNGATHTMTGNLELHGIKKSVTFPATFKVSEGSVTTTAEFSINRKDFGMEYPGVVDDLIRDEIVIKLDIKGQREPG